MQAGIEAVFSTTSTTSTFASGAVTKTDSTNIFPTFTVNLNSLLYPALRLTAGGVFEVDVRSSTSGPVTTDSTVTRSRPFALLRSTNPVFSPGIGYYRREGVTRTAGLPTLKLVSDEYAAYLGWNPQGGPRSDFQFLKTNTFDGERRFEDRSRDFGSMTSDFSHWGLNLYYRGTYIDTNDRVNRLDTRQVSHAGRLGYSESFIADRLRWNTIANVDHLDLRTTARGDGGEVAVPVTPFAGLSTVSDTPATVTLSDNPALIDGNLTAAAGINLGVPPSPIGAQIRNIGLDLLTPAVVNRFLVWVDRELPLEIANSFSWEIFSSQDNLTWRREASVPVARFGTFEHHFEIDFPAVTARYIKVVTRPLSPAVPDASRFTDIFVTELQAFVSRPATEVDDRLTRGTYRLNTNARMRLLDRPGLYYEGLYFYSGTDGSGRRIDTLSNGLSVTHAFGRFVSMFARGAREQGRDVRGDRVATVSTATLTVEPVPTLRSSFLFSGLTERTAGMPTSRRGLFVQNSARPYQGIDVLFGFGWTYTERETGEISRDRLANASATIVPLAQFSLTLSYDERTTDRSGTFEGPPEYRQRRSYAAVAFDPSRTIHLVLGGEVIVTTGQATRTALNISTSWTPFPDGTLQIVFAYNETVRPVQFGTERNAVSAVRWNVSPRSYIDVSFQRTRGVTEFVTTEVRIFSARVRLFL